jgi:hypothetical protein
MYVLLGEWFATASELTDAYLVSLRGIGCRRGGWICGLAKRQDRLGPPIQRGGSDRQSSHRPWLRSVGKLTCKGAKSDSLSISSKPSVWSLVMINPSLRSPPCTLNRQLLNMKVFKLADTRCVTYLTSSLSTFPAFVNFSNNSGTKLLSTRQLSS